MKFSKLTLIMLPAISFITHADEYYQVATLIYQDSEVVASPVMVVAANKPASILIGDDVSYVVTLSPEANGIFGVTAALNMGDYQMHPQMQVKLNQPASIEIDGHKLALTVSKQH